MKKIGIVTIIDYNNYGNRLQNYALYKTVLSLGYECETILNFPGQKNIIERLRNKSIKDLISFLHDKFSSREKTNYKIQNYEHQRLLNSRIRKMKDFSKQHLGESIFTVQNDIFPSQYINNYDAFIVGSDQVWNPFYRNVGTVDFLKFAKKNQRISYAASFGVSEIPQNYKKKLSVGLAGISHISVREKTGVSLVQELSNKQANVHVDPTLLLSSKDWLKLSKPCNVIPQRKYLLRFFVGEMTNEYARHTQYIADKHDLVILELNNPEQAEAYVIDPSEFISCINSASIICTDSFHGSVFSIIFNKPFIVYERSGSKENMNSRIDTLLETFGLKDNRKTNTVKRINFSDKQLLHVKRIIEEERSRSIDYLKISLSDSFSKS